MPSGIAALVSERAAGAPGDAAVVEGRTGAALTWRDLAASIDAWGARAGPPGAAVVLREAKPLSFITAYLGLVAAGAVVLPVDPAGGDAELAAVVDGFVVDGDPVPWADPGTVVLRTSGSTGTPKGVPLTEAQLLHAAGLVATHHALSPGDTVYSPLPLFHVNAEVVGVLASVVSGARLVVDDRFHRHGFWDVLDRCGVTVLNAVPAILAILGDEPAPPPRVAARIRFARSASAPLPAAVQRRFEDRCGIGVLETYGMTEAAGQICANPLQPSARRPGSVGLPVGVDLRIVDEEGVPVPAGSPGLVEIRGPSVATHYVVAGAPPARRPAVEVSGWLRSGDVGLREPDGFVHLMGRTDGVINRGGEKVYPREVEEVLRRHPGVADAAVVGEPDPVLGERPVAFVVPRRLGGEVATDLPGELLAGCEHELGRHKRPVRIHVTDRLPSTATGKVRHAELRALAGT